MKKTNINPIFKFVFILFVIALIFRPIVLNAQQELTNANVRQFFEKLANYKTEDISPLFSKEFLAAVSANQLKDILINIEKSYGVFLKAELTEDKTVNLKYERANATALISFDKEGKVYGLLFKSFTAKNDSFDKIKEDLLKQTGIVSVCIRKNGAEIFSLNKDKPLAIGSTFKLYVLKALIDKINAGNAKWDDILCLKEAQKSLPSGILQEWPDDSPLTLNTLANLMISRSDNTATDILINYLGRETIEKIATQGMIPFLKTSEMFKLKWGVDKNITEKFINGTITQKREIINDIAKYNINIVNANEITEPTYIDKIEWFATTQDLCAIIEKLIGSPVLTINTGLAEKKDWYYAGFKGGSEPGVLNLTQILQKTKDGDIYSISATINNTEEAVDTGKSFTMLVQRLIDLCGKK